MVTGYEVDMYRDIKSIAQSLSKIANVLEKINKHIEEEMEEYADK